MRNAEKLVKHFVGTHSINASGRDYFTTDGLAKLQSYLGKVRVGQSQVYTAPFAKGDSTRKVLEDWDRILVSIEPKWPTLYSFEKDLAKKVGPLSVQYPLRERMTDIAHYYRDILLPSQPISSEAMYSVINEFSKSGSLRLRSVLDTVAKMKKSTNSGNPFFMKRRYAVLDTIPCSSFISISNIDKYTDVWGKFKQKDVWDMCAIVGWRGQEGGPGEEDVKQRTVWMFPMSVNINELQVYQPFIEQCQKFNIVPAWVSMDEVDKKVTALFDTKGDNDLVVCTDFSKFDHHFNSDLQNCAKTILQSLLARGKVSDDWIRFVFPIKYYIPLCYDVVDATSDDATISILGGHHGMASGSGGTNVDETLVHRSLQYEAAILHGAELNPNSQCLGDDGILSYPGITVEDVVAAYESHGQECNFDKQYASTQDCVYLRRWHHKDYRVNGVCAGVYSTFRALGRLRYLERFMDPEYWSSELVALRQLSIIENCKFHPLREEFAQFCMKRDKYRLGLDIPGFFDRLPRLAKEATDHMQDFLGYTKTLQGEGPSGINDWWIVNYLKSVR
nr:MAG: putative RNA-dependent RNA polymerase [Picobirnavirus sp.]